MSNNTPKELASPGPETEDAKSAAESIAEQTAALNQARIELASKEIQEILKKYGVQIRAIPQLVVTSQ